jgi:hypothetical protein
MVSLGVPSCPISADWCPILCPIEQKWCPIYDRIVSHLLSLCVPTCVRRALLPWAVAMLCLVEKTVDMSLEPRCREK